MMFIHHLLGFQWWIDPANMYHCFSNIEFEFYKILASSCKLCVGIFVFTTGYAFCLNGLNGRIKRILGVVSKYWLVYLLFILIGYFAHEPLPKLNVASLQLFGLHLATGFNWDFNTSIHPIFAWYVSFYIVFVLSLPLLEKTSKFGFFKDAILVFVITNFLADILSYQGIIDIPFDVLCVVKRYASWAPIGWLGFLFAKYDLFKKFDKYFLKNIRYENVVCLLGGILVLLIMLVRYKTILISERFTLLDIIYTPIIIIYFTLIFNKFQNTKINCILESLQRNGLMMWFIHSIFFTPNKTFQWIAYLPKHPLLIVAWTLILTWLVSVVINTMIEYVIKKGTMIYGK